MSAPNLSVQLGSLRLRNPVMTASGTFGYGQEYAELLDLERLGAVVVKGIRLDETRGNPPPRTVETPCGLINAIGLPGPGVDGFLKNNMPFLRRRNVPVIVNLWGRTVDEYAEVAARVGAADGVSALEVNVSCPNIKEGGALFGADPALFEQTIKAVRARTDRPMLVKLGPDLFRIAEFARRAEASGADALSITNTLPAMAIDIETRRPILGNRVGGLSGPAIRPVAVKLVWEAARAVKIPIVGMGGIACARDAIEFMIAGATAVAVGTATFLEPETALRVIDGIRAYLEKHNLASVSELTGSLSL